MRIIHATKVFKRDVKRLYRSGKFKSDELEQALGWLQCDSQLPERFQDHPLSGAWKAIKARDCHIKPDIVLIYSKSPGELRLHRIGSHSEILDK